LEGKRIPEFANRGERWFDAVAGSSAISRLGVGLTRHRLRVLAYHGISDAASFSEQMAILRDDFHAVGAKQVLDAIQHGRKLPERAVWVTFDDADPSVIDVALPVLDQRQVPSTVFVCPGMVDGDHPYWWQVVERFAAEGLPFPSSLPVTKEAEALRRLKSMSDAQRRSTVEEMTSVMADAGIGLRHSQISTRQLQRYVEHGGTVGNHTWDHPCLNRCHPDEQRRQVIEAHEWIRDRFPSQPLLFAYPNGDWALQAEEVLTELGYGVAVTFDHRLAHLRRQSPLRLSRLRANSELSLDRYRAILGGFHPLAHRFRMARDRVTS
jgi:peptidoglycan/xylan/chitin deacetylase (PgdA/CDA1 family)